MYSFIKNDITRSYNKTYTLGVVQLVRMQKIPILRYSPPYCTHLLTTYLRIGIDDRSLPFDAYLLIEWRLNNNIINDAQKLGYPELRA